MNRSRKLSPTIALALGLAASSAIGNPQAQTTQELRPGLSAQQTKQAEKLARGAMTELRKKTDGGTAAGADRREYVVSVELLRANPPAARRPKDDSGLPKQAPERASEAETKKSEAKPSVPTSSDPASNAPKKPGPFAVVTSYRYLDDMTVYSTVDLGGVRVVDVQALQHVRSPLSDDEFEEAKSLARDQSQPVKALFEKFGDRLSAFPQFSQFTVKGDPRIHRVIHLTYRVGTKDLSYPRPVIDLTTRTVETPSPEVFPQPRRR